MLQVISSCADSPLTIPALDSPNQGRTEHIAPGPSQLCRWAKAHFQGLGEQALPRSRSLSSWKKVPRIRIKFFESSRTSQGPVSLS